MFQYLDIFQLQTKRTKVKTVHVHLVIKLCSGKNFAIPLPHSTNTSAHSHITNSAHAHSTNSAHDMLTAQTVHMPTAQCLPTIAITHKALGSSAGGLASASCEPVVRGPSSGLSFAHRLSTLFLSSPYFLPYCRTFIIGGGIGQLAHYINVHTNYYCSY